MVEMRGNRFYITPKERLMKELDRAIAENKGFVIMTSLEGFVEEEYTINGPKMLPIKKIQYENSFDDELFQISERRVKVSRYSAIDYEPDMIPGGDRD